MVLRVKLALLGLLFAAAALLVVLPEASAANPCQEFGSGFCVANDAVGNVPLGADVTVSAYTNMPSTAISSVRFVWKNPSGSAVFQEVVTASGTCTPDSGFPSCDGFSHATGVNGWAQLFTSRHEVPVGSSSLGDWGVQVCYNSGSGSNNACDGTGYVTFRTAATSFFAVPEGPLGALIGVVIPIAAIGGYLFLKRGTAPHLAR